MSDLLAVLLDDAVAGSITRLQGGRLRFDYDDDYRTTSGITPLSVSMPKSVRSHPDTVISPWLWGLLPDNSRVLERWSRQFHAATKPFSLLSTPIGHDCAGAVRFAPTDQVLQVLGAPGSVTWLTEGEVPRGYESYARTAQHGSDENSPSSSVLRGHRRRRRFSSRTVAGAFHPGQRPPTIS